MSAQAQRERPARLRDRAHAPGANVQRDVATLLKGCERHYLEPLTAGERRTLLELLGRLVARDLGKT